MYQKHISLLFAVFALVAVTPAFAQRGGGQGKQGGQPNPQATQDERERALNARTWQGPIEAARASSPQAPMPKIRFPTANESFLGSLRWAPNPKQELAKYLDKLWKDAKEPAGQKTAVAGLWQDAEKPTWARPAIEDYYAKRSNGQSLNKAPEPMAIEAAPAAGATPAAAPASATPTKTASAAPAAPTATAAAAKPAAGK
ncbi:MAG TPA: hypothetical protein VIA18_22630 [Polyangia bacterium]|nr:hypothetical protein [Polyangia bacterium]